MSSKLNESLCMRRPKALEYTSKLEKNRQTLITSVKRKEIHNNVVETRKFNWVTLQCCLQSIYHSIYTCTWNKTSGRRKRPRCTHSKMMDIFTMRISWTSWTNIINVSIINIRTEFTTKISFIEIGFPTGRSLYLFISVSLYRENNSGRSSKSTR